MPAMSVEESELNCLDKKKIKKNQQLLWIFGSLTHHISLNGAGISVLATWDTYLISVDIVKLQVVAKDSCDKYDLLTPLHTISTIKRVSFPINGPSLKIVIPQPHKNIGNREPMSTINGYTEIYQGFKGTHQD
ncbi:unnamed protein product [Rhizopus stolonifer]